MALQGTIETFALPDVMRLLASTKKTGCLRLEGSRGAGSVWVDSGQIVATEASEAPHADGAVEVFFELLRFKDGAFVFDADITPTDPSPAVEVEPVLDEAEKMLDEWKAIEAVVPSLDSWVSLVPELEADEVSISKDRWRLLVAVGGGTTAGQLGDQLQLGELPVSRSVKELVESGLVSVGEAPAGAVLTPAAAPAPAPVAEPAPAAPVYEEPAPAFEPAPVAEPAPAFEPSLEVSDNGGVEVEEATEAAYEPFDPDALIIEHEEVAAEPVAAAPAAPNGGLDTDPGDAAEIARQLANLSPKAAKAVAAAAKATTQEEREAALAEVDDEDDPINRDLLIKFLGSVNG